MNALKKMMIKRMVKKHIKDVKKAVLKKVPIKGQSKLTFRK